MIGVLLQCFGTRPVHSHIVHAQLGVLTWCAAHSPGDTLMHTIMQSPVRLMPRSLPGGSLMQAAGRVHDGPEKCREEGRDG